MRTEAVQFVFALLALAFGSAAECLLPKALGVGFPALLAATAFFAPRRGVLPAVCFALVAGAAEDALSGLPFTVSAAFFTMMAAAARGSGMPRLAAVLAYPVYQLWLWLWNPGLVGSVFIRFLVSLPIGAATVFLVFLALAGVERKAAADAH